MTLDDFYFVERVYARWLATGESNEEMKLLGGPVPCSDMVQTFLNEQGVGFRGEYFALRHGFHSKVDGFDWVSQAAKDGFMK